MLVDPQVGHLGLSSSSFLVLSIFTHILIIRERIFIMKKIIYTLKQLLPLTYHSKYRVQNGSKELAIWTQWFGKPFNIKRFTLVD